MMKVNGLKNKMQCNKCNTSFVPTHSSHISCPDCHKKGKIELNNIQKVKEMTDRKTCVICKNQFISPTDQKLSETEYLDRCRSCIGKRLVKCDYCHDEYYGIISRRFLEKKGCPACILLRSAIFDKELDMLFKNRIKPGLKLCITYRVIKETHDGYCSDPYDEGEEEKIKTFSYPVLDTFKNVHIDNDGNVISLDSGPILIYLSDYQKQCSRGSGYCGKMTTYIPISAVIMKDKRKIDLGE